MLRLSKQHAFASTSLGKQHLLNKNSVKKCFQEHFLFGVFSYFYYVTCYDVLLATVKRESIQIISDMLL